jgi:hypothetical protein
MLSLSNGVTVGFYDLVNNGIANLSKPTVTPFDKLSII